MLLKSASLAISQLFSKPFRKLFWRMVGYTLLLLIAVWFVMSSAISTFLLPFVGDAALWGISIGAWLTTALVWFSGVGMFVGAGFLIGPVSAIFAGLFLDDVAERVEERHYFDDPPGKELPLSLSAWLAAKFTVLVVIANIIALMLVLLPGINFIIFFFLNGYLLGREYFQFAAMRFIAEEDAKAMRQAHEGEIFLGGVIIAGFMSIPLLNLATPIFAAAMMVHVHKNIAARV